MSHTWNNEEPIAVSLRDIRIGSIPNLTGLIPKNNRDLFDTLFTGITTGFLAHSLDAHIMTAVGLGAIGYTLPYLLTRLDTLDDRMGYIGNIPAAVKAITTSVMASDVNVPVTELLRERTGDETLTVRENRTKQFSIFTVKNLDPKPIAACKDSLGMLLGVDSSEIMFIQTFTKKTSAFLVPLENEVWEDVLFDNNYLIDGELQGYIGQSITDEPILYNRKMYPHMLISGTTGSGKTVFMEADIHAMRNSGLNPDIYIIDAKGDFEHTPCKEYISDINQASDLLYRISLIAEERKSKYNKAKCRNFFEYREKVNKNEKPLFLYIDELAVLLEAKKEVSEPCRELIALMCRRDRAAGLFITLGLQRPDASILTGELKSNLSIKIAFSQVDDVSSRVAIESNLAAYLPLYGGVIVKKTGSKKLIIGRACKINY